MSIRPNQLINWGTPLGNSELLSFYNSVGTEGVLGLVVRQPDGANEAACVVVNRDEHTQGIMYQLFESGRLYESHTTAVAVGALRPGDTAIDVGAHVGYFTALFRLCVGKAGRVFAFEPMPSTYRRLLRNVLGNDFHNVMALPMALSDENGEAHFFLDPENEGESSLVVRPELRSCVVQTTSLDELFADSLRVRPRVMKLDAEGVELKILRGGKRFFAAHAPDLVICEHNRTALREAGVTPDDLRQFFAQHGYRCGVINNGLGMDMGGATFYRMVTANEPLQADDYGYVFNLMFVRDGSGLYTNDMM